MKVNILQIIFFDKHQNWERFATKNRRRHEAPVHPQELKDVLMFGEGLAEEMVSSVAISGSQLVLLG